MPPFYAKKKTVAAKRSGFRARKSMYGMYKTGYNGMQRARTGAGGMQFGRAVIRGRGLSGETKAIDFTNAGGAGGNFSVPFNVLPSTNNLSLCVIQEGTGFNNRIGRKVALLSLTIRASIAQVTVPAVTVPECLRIIIGIDRQCNGIAAVWSDIIADVTQSGVKTSQLWSGPNLDNRDRFMILRDRYVCMPGTTAAGAPNCAPWGTSSASVGSAKGSDGGCNYQEYLKLGNAEVQFNGTANPCTVANITTGNLFIIGLGSIGAQYSMSGSARLRFTDL